MNDLLSEGLPGQIRAKEILSRLFKARRVPHAFLISGPKGVGRHKLVQNFLKLLNSDLNEDAKQRVFRGIDSFAEPYVKFILPLPRGKGETNTDGPLDKLSASQIEEIAEQIKTKADNPYRQIELKDANAIKINSIRDIRKFISLNFSEVNYRGIIISDAHLMSIESQNALLKSLEEPPEGNIFFLITDSPDLLLETIRSRCWEISLPPLTVEEIRQILSEKFEFSEEESRKLALISDGSVAQALEYSNYDLEELFNSAITIIRYGMAGRYFTALSEMNKYTETRDVKNILSIINLILLWFRDTDKFKRIGEIDFFVDFKETIEKFTAKFSHVDIAEISANINRLVQQMGNNVNLNVITLNIIFELSNIIKRNNSNVSYKYSSPRR